MSILNTALKRIGKLESAVKSLKPVQAPGTLVNLTTRGVSVRNVRQDAPTSKPASSVPTWG